MTGGDQSAAEFTIERFDSSDVVRPTKWFGAEGHHGFVYVIRRNGERVWSAGIDFGEASHVPFREELFWASTGTIVIGGGNFVYVFDAHRGELRTTITIPSFFGHLAVQAVPTASGALEEVLLIMGWADVHCWDSLAPCWLLPADPAKHRARPCRWEPSSIAPARARLRAGARPFAWPPTWPTEDFCRRASIPA